MSRLGHRNRLLRQTWIAPISFVFIAFTVAGCGNKSSGPSAPLSAHAGSARSAEDSRRVGEGLKLLMDSLDKPQTGLHFSYQSQENLNPKFPLQAGSKPEVGTVQVEADITPDDIDVNETRGGKKTETKAKKSDPMFGLAKLPVLGSMLGATFPLALGGPTAQFAGSDTVGGAVADKFNIDTTTANATTQAGMEVAAGLLGGKVAIKSVKGAVWFEKTSGRLVKFNLDTDLGTQDGQSWREHSEAVVTPK